MKINLKSSGESSALAIVWLRAKSDKYFVLLHISLQQLWQIKGTVGPDLCMKLQLPLEEVLSCNERTSGAERQYFPWPDYFIKIKNK